MRLDSQQLVTAFLLDALSSKMIFCHQSGKHCMCQTTFRAARSFAIMSSVTTRRTCPWSSITARFWTTTRVPMCKLHKKTQTFHRRTTFFFRCVCLFFCGNRNVLNICMHTYKTDIQMHKFFPGHKRYPGWTGNFGPVWQCKMVWKQRHTVL